MTAKLIETSWAEFSSAFVKFHRLPHGTALRLFDPSGRKKRSDFKIKRQRVTARAMQRADDDDNVRALLDVAIGVVSTDLRTRRLRVELYGPNDQPLNGNTLVRKVRRMEPKSTPDDLARDLEEIALVESLQAVAGMSIAESEHLVDDPSKTVCLAFVNALSERYGRSAVLAAIGR
jgi:hypothetical protein